MDIYNDAFLKLIGFFNKYQVQYILVGGFSTNFHGYKRSTGDIDFWLEDTPKNRKNLIKSLADFGIEEVDALMDLPLVPGFCEILLENGIYIDLMDRITGFDQTDFRNCYEVAEISIVNDQPIRFLHYNHHILSKEKSDRLKDQLDVQELKRINKNSDEEG